MPLEGLVILGALASLADLHGSHRNSGQRFASMAYSLDLGMGIAFGHHKRLALAYNIHTKGGQRCG